MQIIAIGTNLKTSDKKFIINMFDASLGDIATVSIIDAISNKIKTTGSEVVVTFGKRAKDLFTSSKEKFLIHMPLSEVSSLVSSDENEDNRESAYNKLLQLKNIDAEPQDNIKIVSEDSLPVIDTKYILSSLALSGSKEWQGINREGKKIRLTLEPTVDPSADINLTFAELLTLKTAMETLQIKEFQIVTNSKLSKE